MCVVGYVVLMPLYSITPFLQKTMVMIRFSLIALLCLLQVAVFPQYMQINWQNCLKMADSDHTRDITIAGDGYMITGYTDITSQMAMLFRTDNEGSLIWEKSYGGSEGDGAYAVFPTLDGNYYIVGGAVSTDGDITFNPYPNSVSYWILKIDSDGNKLWDKVYGGNGKDEVFDAIPTSDGGLAVIGYTTSSDGDVSAYYGGWDSWLLKLDSAGNKMWDFTYGTSLIELGEAVIETSDGGFLAGGTGRLNVGGNIDCNPFSWYAMALLFKLDANGNLEWQQCYGGSWDDGIQTLLEVSNGYILGGFTDSDDGDMTGCGYHLGYFPGISGTRTSDIWLAKADFFGNLIWQTCLGGTKMDFVKRIFETADGSLLLFGHTSSHDGDVVGNHSYNDLAYRDIWVVKVNSEGELLWQQCIGSTWRNDIADVVRTGDNTYVVASRTTSAADGDLTCTFSPFTFTWVFEVEDITTGMNEIPGEVEVLKVYPNPANKQLWVSIPDNVSLAGAIAELIGFDGRKSILIHPDSHTFKIETGYLPSGPYLLRLQAGERVLTAMVVLKKH